MFWKYLRDLLGLNGQRSNSKPRGAGNTPQDLRSLSEAELTGICDRYWRSLSLPSAAGDVPDYSHYVNVINELANRDAAILAWARERLTHQEYEAREQAAFLLGQLASKKLLGENLPAVIGDLSTLALRPVVEDGKEAQANTAAIMALGNTMDVRAIPALRTVLTSPEWEEDDNRWAAALELGKIVGEDWSKTDPVESAMAWVQRNPG